MTDMREYLIAALTQGLVVETKSLTLAQDLCDYFDKNNTCNLSSFYSTSNSTIYFEDKKSVTYLELACIENGILVFKTPAYDGILDPLMSGKILMVVMSFLNNNRDILSYDLLGDLPTVEPKHINKTDFGIV
tara:strand:- start:806 stop:1201 length:396 start_codon:yes stop_codon:yes gene_type:complete